MVLGITENARAVSWHADDDLHADHDEHLEHRRGEGPHRAPASPGANRSCDVT